MPRSESGTIPNDMGAVELAAFLSHLAVTGRVSASTQNQALCVGFVIVVTTLSAPSQSDKCQRDTPQVPDYFNLSGMSAIT